MVSVCSVLAISTSAHMYVCMYSKYCYVLSAYSYLIRMFAFNYSFSSCELAE